MTRHCSYMFLDHLKHLQQPNDTTDCGVCSYEVELEISIVPGNKHKCITPG